MSRFTYPLDSIPLAFPLGFDFCGIHASLLYQNSLDGTVVFPYITPLCTGATQSILHHIHHHLGAGVGFGVGNSKMVLALTAIIGTAEASIIIALSTEVEFERGLPSLATVKAEKKK
jgi:hypothetical protein